MMDILNGGWSRRGAYVRLKSRTFNVFGFIAFAAIKNLYETLEDRCIVIEMQRKRRDEVRESWRRNKSTLVELARKSKRWVADHIDELGEDADPPVPDAIDDDRAAENWRIPLAIADLAGSTWPKRARDAMLALAANREETSEAEMLLHDLQDPEVWKPDPTQRNRIASLVLLASLKKLAGRPWADAKFDENKLARLIAPFRRPDGQNIRPRVLRLGRGKRAPQKRAYDWDWFVDAFARYPRPAPDSDDDTADSGQTALPATADSDETPFVMPATSKTYPFEIVVQPVDVKVRPKPAETPVTPSQPPASPVTPIPPSSAKQATAKVNRNTRTTPDC
jgi:hypothetical protein